jgi:glycyl-tRNA synthetase beta chain
MGADAELTARAALLAKCDLVSEMVLEFPELQGIAGAYYAEHDGEPQVVSEAVEQHYWPRFAGDRLPTTLEATAVALADRLDTLVGIFGIGQTPTGSKDPFALRRASLAVIRMLIANDVALDLDELINHAVNQYPEQVLEHDPETSVKDYILERLKAWYDDQGIGVDVLRAVLATGMANAAEIDRRVSSVHEFAQTDAAASLAAANKRVANILAKATEQAQANVDTALFETPEENSLFKALRESEDSLTPLLAARDYRAALAGLATLQTPVDAFFEGVMVNAEEPSIRQNRYNLLYMLRQQFIRIADIALLASTGS